MKERPILFSAPMVRALLDGSKTQTRRIVKPQPPDEATGACWLEINGRPVWQWVANGDQQGIIASEKPFSCAYGQPGDRLWVRETFYEEFCRAPSDADERLDWVESGYLAYRASDEQPYGSGGNLPWKPSIFMPRWASRIMLEVVSVRVDRLHDISEADAVTEGIRISSQARRSEACYGIYECQMPDGKTHFNDSAYNLYRALWEQINGPSSWAANPWVWVVEFKKLDT